MIFIGNRLKMTTLINWLQTSFMFPHAGIKVNVVKSGYDRMYKRLTQEGILNLQELN